MIDRIRERVHLNTSHRSRAATWTVRSCARGTDLGQEEEEDLVVGEDGVRGDAQQEVLQAHPPPLDKVWVEVVGGQLVPHKLCLQEPQIHMHEHMLFLLTFRILFS